MITSKSKEANSVVKKVEISLEGGVFKGIFKKIIGDDSSDVSKLRRLLSDQRARILHVIKTKNPSSIYQLTKLLKRDFRTVKDDLKLLQRFSLVDLRMGYKGGRKRLKPVLIADKILITITL